jgi:hypothetical protein
MRTVLVVVGALCVSACPLFAQQQPEPAVATESVAAVSADSVDVDSKLEKHFRDKFAHARPGVTFKRLHRTPAEGVVVAELQNDWLTHTFRIRASNDPDGIDAPAVSAEAVEAAISEFGKLKPVDATRLAATLRGLGTTLAEVYRPATAPYFNNGRGLVFDRKQRRYYLVARGVRDLAANQCFKAAIDVATGDVVSNASVPCAVE